MDTLSVAQIASQLGTTVPRVQRAIDSMNLRVLAGPRGRVLAPEQVARVRERLGSAPIVEGFSREDLFVLAALNRHPLGLRSVRAVGRAAGVSPTTSSRCLARLIQRSLVVARRVRLVEGVVVDAVVFDIDRGSDSWWRTAHEVREVVLPQVRGAAASHRLPRRFWQHFWNGNPGSIRLPKDESYVAGRLLLSDDPEAISWAATHLSGDAIAASADLRGTSARDQALLRHLGSAAA